MFGVCLQRRLSNLAFSGHMPACCLTATVAVAWCHIGATAAIWFAKLDSLFAVVRLVLNICKACIDNGLQLRGMTFPDCDRCHQTGTDSASKCCSEVHQSRSPERERLI